MPGKGSIATRASTDGEINPALGANLASSTYDIYLNERIYWRNVPPHVWDYTIGSYQVLKKWLSYRERPLLGRSLTIDEVREVSGIARRIAAILCLESQLDTNYCAVADEAAPR